jgi:hypothetical protein
MPETKADLRDEIRDLLDELDAAVDGDEPFANDELREIGEKLHRKPSVVSAGHLRYEVTVMASSRISADVARSTADISRKGELQKDELVGVRDALLEVLDEDEPEPEEVDA